MEDSGATQRILHSVGNGASSLVVVSECALLGEPFWKMHIIFLQPCAGILIIVKRVKRKVLPEPYGPLGGTYLRSIGPQPDTSLHCKDRGYEASASRGVSIYSPAVRPVPNYTAW